LETCQHCRERATRLAKAQGRLTEQLFRLECPSSHELGEYHLGTLTREREASIRQHVADCSRCIAELAQLKAFLADLAPEVEFTPLQRVRVLIARLLDGDDDEQNGWSGLRPAFAGIRGAADEPRIFQAEDIQIAIEIQDDIEQPGRRAVLGLLTGSDDLNSFEVELWQEGNLINTVPIGNTGNFILPHLPAGGYQLLIRGPKVEIYVVDLAA
jgi:hypothetical protein